MRRLTLLAIRDCPLSAHGREVLDKLAREHLLRWSEAPADSDIGSALRAGAPGLLPALFDESGALIAHGRLSEKRLRRELAARSERR